MERNDCRCVPYLELFVVLVRQEFKSVRLLVLVSRQVVGEQFADEQYGQSQDRADRHRAAEKRLVLGVLAEANADRGWEYVQLTKHLLLLKEINSI